ncbi:MAG TPA: hypothetical protein VI756_25110, partial [Blastocatellia bacterium]
MRRSTGLRLLFVILATFLLASASMLVTGVGARSTPLASAKPTGRRVGEVPAAATSDAFQEYLAANESMTMVISFEPRDRAGLRKLIAD